MANWSLVSFYSEYDFSHVFPNDINVGESSDDEYKEEDEEGEEEVVLDDENLTDAEVEALGNVGIKPVVWVADTGVIWVAEVTDDVRDRLHTRILTDFSGKGMRKQ